ncbi:MAG: lysophospholipase [Alphaproteobacteria bacterium]|nr:lysophospholipase [Alphaproteobacteria bacterium]
MSEASAAAATTSYEYDREPFLIVFDESSAIKETYAGQLGKIVLEAHRLAPRGVPAKLVMIFMHPIGGTQYLPMLAAFAKAGIHVISCNSRYPRNDSALIMEKVAADLGACVRHAREKFGYQTVVLGGWSGGGSLSLFYQSQAEAPTITQTPAGDAYDLTAAGLIPADAVMLLAAHTSRAKTLTEWLDPSISDETDSFSRDPALNIYDPANPNQPPYDTAWLETYRAAQIARNRRITDWVQSLLAEGKKREGETFEHCFVVHGTMADPAWLDPAIEPNGRKPGWCMMGDPKMVNDAPAGLARFCTLRSWLSQWSYDLSNADGPESAKRITVPALMIENSADDGCLPHHNRRFWDAIGHTDKEKHVIEGANHYYFGQPDKAGEAVALCRDWLQRRGFL